MFDPIAELVESLEDGGGPSGAWVLRWSEGGVEPFAAAWSESHDLVAMAQLLEVLEHAAWLAASPRDLARASSAIPDGWSFGDSDALRTALDAPPSLGEVVAAWRVVAPHRHGSVRPSPPATSTATAFDEPRDTIKAPPLRPHLGRASSPPPLPRMR